MKAALWTLAAAAGALLAVLWLGLSGPWHHLCYPQPWNDSTEPTWVDGLARSIIDRWGQS